MSMTHYSRLMQAPGASFFLFGVRGVGKSTWVGSVLPEAHWIDLLDERRYNELLADPGMFAAEIATLPPESWVVLDEVQRLPNLLNEVHRHIEQKKLRFALLGSSARKLKTGSTNLLAGRALWKTMYPLTPEELGKDFELGRVLRFGSIPLIWQAENAEATLEAYVQLYLREEIRLEALVRNLPAFARFLPIAALFHGQSINVSSIARDARTARTTIAGYLDILEDTLLTFRLPAFESRLRVRERRLPKLYWIDPGVVRAVKKHTGPVAAEEEGALFEGWVLSLLRTYREERRLCDDLAFWSPHQSRVEVDFLLRRQREFLALEVKASSHFSRSQLDGLLAIGDLPGLVRRILVYRGSSKITTPEGIEVWTVSDLLKALEEDRIWP